MIPLVYVYQIRPDKYRVTIRYEEGPAPDNTRYDERFLRSWQYQILKEDPDFPAAWLVDDRQQMRSYQSIWRSAQAVRGLALANSWDWFITVTLNPRFHDRSDLDSFRSEFTHFIRDARRKYGVDIEYLLVPELHPSDGVSWHMHGLIQGLPVEALRPFTLEEKLPYYILDKVTTGVPIYDWPAYRARFGFTSVERVRNRDRASTYLTKYIGKSLQDSAQAVEAGHSLYYASRGLDRPQRVAIISTPEDLPGVLPAGLECSWLKKHHYGEVMYFDLPTVTPILPD